MSKRGKQIHIAPIHKKAIEDELEVSDQTVRNALKYHTDGDTPRQIRQMAKSLLRKEANKIKKED